MSRLFRVALVSAPFFAGLFASGVATAANDLSLESIDSRKLAEVVQQQEQVQSRDLLQERSRVGGDDAAAGGMQQQRERQQQQIRTQTKTKTQSQTPAGGSGGRGYSGAGGSGRGTGGGGRR